MAQFPGITLTNAGLNMIAESQASSTALIFTSLKMGDGSLDTGEDIKLLTTIKNLMLSAPIQSYTNQGDGQVKLRFTISNGTLMTGFFARELGIYAKIGESGIEQLYAYTNAGNLTDFIPDKNTPIDEQIIDIYLVVGNASSVKVITDTSIMYATMSDLSKHDNSITAHSELIKLHNKDESAHPSFRTLIETSGLNLLKRNKSYDIGDIAYSNNLPSWARLECVIPGITASSEQMFGSIAGGLITDGTVTWIMDDIRDSNCVGQIIGDIYIKAGHIKANGATVNRADYPRLLKLATDNNLFYDDGTRVFIGTTSSGGITLSGISTIDIAKLRVGFTISGTGIAAGTIITAISTTSITISTAATASGTVSISYGNATNFPRLYGKGDSNTTFVVPDMRGVTRRFLDDGKGYDTGRNLGSYQSDDLKSHNHSVWYAYSTSYLYTGVGSGNWGFANGGTSYTGNAGGNETRMKNIAEYALIKY
jgi:hypothetical protein